MAIQLLSTSAPNRKKQKYIGAANAVVRQNVFFRSLTNLDLLKVKYTHHELEKSKIDEKAEHGLVYNPHVAVIGRWTRNMCISHPKYALHVAKRLISEHPNSRETLGAAFAISYALKTSGNMPEALIAKETFKNQIEKMKREKVTVAYPDAFQAVADVFEGKKEADKIFKANELLYKNSQNAIGHFVEVLLEAVLPMVEMLPFIIKNILQRNQQNPRAALEPE
jgi:hypothetical protein